jgi:hypothetical protein
VRSAALDTLRHHYVDRLEAAHAAHASGMGVVGVVGNTVPRELILGAGYFPLLISTESGEATPTADLYMEDVIPPETKCLFGLAVSGRLEFLDLLVLSRPYAQLYYYLKEVHRLGRAPHVPPLHMFDLIRTQREAVRAYDLFEINALIQRLLTLPSAAGWKHRTLFDKRLEQLLGKECVALRLSVHEREDIIRNVLA